MGFLMRYNGSIPPLSLERPLRGAVKTVRRSLGAHLFDTFVSRSFGKSNGLVRIEPEYMDTFLVPQSARELAHRWQSSKQGHMHRYDYGSPEKNRAVYGETSPLKYDLSTIKLETITIWLANDDSYVNESDIQRLLGSFSGKTHSSAGLEFTFRPY